MPVGDVRPVDESMVVGARVDDVTGIVVAGGSGERLGADVPKAFVEVGGHSMLWWSVELLRAGGIDDLVVVVPADSFDRARAEVGDAVRLVAGGASRTASVAAGLAALPDGCEVVAVHDAARPFVPVEVVRKVVQAVTRADGVVAAAPGSAVADTLKRVGAGRVVQATVDRTELVAVQTPQVFRRDVLEAAHRHAATVGTAGTDDLALVERLVEDGLVEGVVVVTPGSPMGMKITYPDDLVLGAGIAGVDRGPPALARRPRLLVLDVDGTLLGEDGTMPDARADALSTVSRLVPAVFATGKTWPSIAALAERFDLAGPHLTCNGAALVSLDGDVEVLSSLPRSTVDDVLDELHARGIATATYLADGTSVAPAWDDGFELISRVAEAPPDITPLPDDAMVLKILAVIDADDEPDDLRDLAAGRARIQRTGPSFLEWNAPDASKGHGLELLARRHGIDLADVVAVGDSENDVSMFEVAGLAVAVSTASSVAVEASDVHLVDDIAAWFTDLAATAGSPDA